jgi:hypothetical protein
MEDGEAGLKWADGFFSERTGRGCGPVELAQGVKEAPLVDRDWVGSRGQRHVRSPRTDPSRTGRRLLARVARPLTGLAVRSREHSLLEGGEDLRWVVLGDDIMGTIGLNSFGGNEQAGPQRENRACAPPSPSVMAQTVHHVETAKRLRSVPLNQSTDCRLCARQMATPIKASQLRCDLQENNRLHF